ncbi:hypothetical protein U1R68_14185 [Pectobacterium colocasium]|uniref:hypothetical protein n=1 Tax=Pectobacterium TaxID=122277 RepID=UPI001CD68A0F|nr:MULTISPECIES: hypothetical protein [Pectobacterium]
MAGMLLLQHDQIKQIVGTINHIYAESSTENGGRCGTRNRHKIDRKNPAQSEKCCLGIGLGNRAITQIW